MKIVFIQLFLFSISLVLLGTYIKSKNKRDFLLSVVAIVLGSTITYYDTQSNIALIFLFAIGFSFFGDLLMAGIISITSDRIINGTIGFGIAHIFYIIGFWQLGEGDLQMQQIILGIVLANVLFYIMVYTPNMKKEMMFATYFYSIIIGGLFVVILRVISSQDFWSKAAIIPLSGILLFMASDSIIARNAFKQKMFHAQEIIAFTYVMSQIILQSTLLII